MNGKKPPLPEDSKVVYEHRPQRGLRLQTIQFYNITTRVVDGNEYSIGFVYPNDAIKSRLVSVKRFFVDGPINEAGLFGRNLFNAGSKQSITITEGEFDAPSIYEAVNGHTAAVSVQSGSTAVRDCKRDYDYINSFDKIILAFDNDEPGQKAARDVASLFDFNKVYHLKFDKYKDANEFLQNNAMAELASSWKNAKKYTPDNIISTFAEVAESLKESREDMIGSYPHPVLQNALYGLHRGEVVVIKGLEGIGKTEVLRAIEYHLLKTEKDIKIGVIHLEEDKATTIRGVATYELNVPCNLPDVGVSEQDALEAYKKAVNGKEDRLYIYTMFGGSDDPEDVLTSIRFLVNQAGVDVVCLDHITMLATGSETDDERRKLDYLSTQLKKMAKALKFCLVMISHVNDAGQTRGSRNITKIANTVIHLNRDITTHEELERNTLHMTIEKARLTGRTGNGGRFLFNTNTFKLEALEQ